MRKNLIVVTCILALSLLTGCGNVATESNDDGAKLLREVKTT